MSEVIAKKGWSYESSLDNVTEELAWVKKQIQRELTDLQKGVQEDQIQKSFFEKKDNKVVYNMNLVKQYLQSCVQKDEFQINSVVVMAVQIALESKWYEVGKIDWLLKNSKWTLSTTEQAIRKFQKENWLHIDWVPWKNTVKKILEKMWGISQWNNLGKGEDKEAPEINEWKGITKEEILALEIYRWKVMSNDEIEAQGYNPEEVRNWVKNTSEMERLDKIVPKNMRHEQATEFLDMHKPSDETDEQPTIPELENPVEKPVEKPVEEPVESKEDNNKVESWESADILIWPKLKATSKKELWGIWSSIMHWFQWYDLRSFWFSNMAWKKNWKADNSRFEEENWKLYENFILPRAELIKYCENHNIKSFMFYFGWNEKSEAERQKALENIEKWWEYLEKWGVQPVLATCIWEDIPQHKDSVGKSYVKEYNAAIKDMQQRHPTWSLIDFVKIDQPDIFRPNDWWHPWDTWYKRMWTKIEQCFSSAEK